MVIRSSDSRLERQELAEETRPPVMSHFSYTEYNKIRLLAEAEEAWLGPTLPRA